MTRFLFSILLTSLTACPIYAQENDTKKEQLEKDAALITAETALINAKAAKTKAEFDALSLPKFENKTTIGEKGGEIEAAMLSGSALKSAASEIMNAKPSVDSNCENEDGPKITCDHSYLITTGDEKVDFNLVKQLEFELKNLTNDMASTVGSYSVVGNNRRPKFAGSGASIAAISAVAGLFGNETVVQGVNVSLSDAMLANAVAGKFNGKAILFGRELGVADLSNSALAKTLEQLLQLKFLAFEKIASFGPSPKPSQKVKIAKIETSIKKFDEFYRRISKADVQGRSQFTNAVRYEKFLSDSMKTRILHVAVNKSGGSLINTKNIATFFGVDPVKVSGGLIASYTYIEPESGYILKAGTLVCQTSLASLRKIQSGLWASQAPKKDDTSKQEIQKNKATCR